MDLKNTARLVGAMAVVAGLVLPGFPMLSVFCKRERERERDTHTHTRTHIEQRAHTDTHTQVSTKHNCILYNKIKKTYVCVVLECAHSCLCGRKRVCACVFALVLPHGGVIFE